MMKWIAAVFLIALLGVGIWRAGNSAVEGVMPEDTRSGSRDESKPRRDTDLSFSGEDRTAEELLALCEKAERRYYDEGGSPHRGYGEFTKSVVAKWSEEEVRRAATGEFHDRFLWAIFERWGTFTPKEGLAFVLAMEKANEVEISLSGTGLEGGPGEAMEGYVGEMMRAMIAGWALKDAERAWQVVSGKELGLGESQVFASYGYLTPITIFEQLAKNRRTNVLGEIEGVSDSSWRQSAIVGFSKGARDDLQWSHLVKAAVAIKPAARSHDHFLGAIRENLMARWLEKDTEAAEEWFENEAPEGVGWKMEERGHPDGTDPFGTTEEEDARAEEKVKRRYSLGSAAHVWFQRDPDAAIQWVSSKVAGGDGVMLRSFLSSIYEDYNWPAEKVSDLMELADQLPDREYAHKILRRLRGEKSDESDPFGFD